MEKGVICGDFPAWQFDLQLSTWLCLGSQPRISVNDVCRHAVCPQEPGASCNFVLPLHILQGVKAGIPDNFGDFGVGVFGFVWFFFLLILKRRPQSSA